MLRKIVFILLPILLNALQCDEGSCDGSDQINSLFETRRSARIMGGDTTEQNSRPFQVITYLN